MRNYKQPLIDPYKAFCKIVDVKVKEKQEILSPLSENILARFGQYRASTTTLAHIGCYTFTIDQKGALIDCYTGKTKPLEEMLTAIRASQPSEIIGQCQYCGIGRPETFDHYLPKEDFPEFSAFALNLLPCCHECNTRKSTEFLRSGKRQIINLYFDHLPTVQFLFTTIKYKDKIPIANFELVKPTSISEDEFEVIIAHYRRLKLLDRFRECAPEVFSETKALIQVHERKRTRSRIQEWLRKEAERFEQLYSVNHWKRVLHLEMSQDQVFISDCCA